MATFRFIGKTSVVDLDKMDEMQAEMLALMEKYDVETVALTTTDSELVSQDVNESLDTRIAEATELILDANCIDGDHHKTWYLDQVLRVLTGDDYEQIIEDYENPGEDEDEDDEDNYAEWDEGIAP